MVSGAGRGLGAGIAQGLARAGARVAICDINETELAQTAAEIGADGLDSLSLHADASSFQAMDDAVTRTVRYWGRLDIMICNAAIMPLTSFSQTTPDLWRQILDVNLGGVYNGVKAAWQQMCEQGSGHCMAIASGASLRGFKDEVAYCAAKHGIEGFTKALAIEAEAAHIAINTVGPGKLIKPTSISREQASEMDPKQTEGWVDPITLAPAFVWLASQPPSRFTGLRFDAGPLADTIAAEGYDFAFAPEKATLYVDDFKARTTERRSWTRL